LTGYGKMGIVTNVPTDFMLLLAAEKLGCRYVPTGTVPLLAWVL
jgi:hypothetical protein